MSVTPKERQRIFELVENGSASKTTMEATLRAIHQEMPHLTVNELKDVCRVHLEELRLDGAVVLAEADALNFIADTLTEMGQANLAGAVEELTLPSEQGDQHAAELLEYLHRAYVLAEEWILITDGEIERRAGR
jgi:hypothetical protein